jgi:zinc protease
MTAPPARLEVFPNGVRLIVRELRTAPVVALSIWVASGSLDDPPGREGVSHFLEHMLFSSDGPGGVDLAKEVQDAGGYLNAETSYDHTMFYQVVPSAGWTRILDSVARVIAAPSFAPRSVASERAVILEEARSGESDPDVFVWRRLLETAFEHCRCRHPVIGTVPSISAIGEEDLSAHWRTHYRAPNMIQVVVGDVDAEDVVEWAGRALAGIPAGPAPVHGIDSEPPHTAARARWYSGPVGQAYAALVFPTPGALHPDVPALSVLAGILGVGRSSRLERTVRRRYGLATAIGAGVADYRDFGLFVVRAACLPPDVDALLQAVLRETEAARSGPPARAEMDRGLRRLEAGYALEHETADGLARVLGFYETLGDLAYAEEYVDRLAAVSAADVTRVAREYLRPEQASIVVLEPGDTPGGQERPGRLRGIVKGGTEARTSFAAEGGGAYRSSGGFTRPVLARESGPPRCRRVTLAAGGSLVVREMRALPVVSLALGFRGGFTEEPAELAGITYLSQKAALLGTTTRSADEIADEIEGLGSAVATSVDRDGTGLGITVLSRYLDEALVALSDVVLNPACGGPHLALARDEVLSEIAEIQDHPLRKAVLRLLPLIFPGHAYGRPLRGEPSTVRALRAEDVLAWHESVCTGRRLRAAVVGDIEAESAAAAVDRVLAGIRLGEDVVPPAPPAERPGGSIVEDLSGRPQSVVVLGLAGPSAGHGAAPSVHLLTAALSMMGGRLWTALRERPPHAYHVGASLVAHGSAGAIVVHATARPGSEDEVVAALGGELERLAEEGLGAQELERGRRHLAGTLEIATMRSAARAAAYMAAETAGVGYERIEALPATVRALTRRDIMTAARTYLDPGRGFASVVLRGDPSADHSLR